MGWSIPTYYGVRATGNPSNYRTAMFEIIRAINERKSAQGIPLLTIWYAADGTLLSSPSIDDLDSTPAYGHNSTAALNMQTISAQIAAPIRGAFGTLDYEKYYRPDLLTPWTVLDLEEDIGHSLTDYPSKFNDAGWWQAMQDALDRMTIVLKDPNIQFSSRIDASRGYDTFPFAPTKQQAWDRRNDHGNYDLNGLDVGWYLTGDFSTFVTHAYAECVRHLRVSTTALSNFDGEIVKSEIDYSFWQNGYAGSFSVTLDGHAISFSGNGTGTLSVDSMVAGENNNIDLVVVQSEPGTVPFTTISTPGTVKYGTGLYLGTFYGYLGYPRARCWLDMSSVLTDQI